jgi:ABC-2 type transport system permease protein
MVTAVGVRPQVRLRHGARRWLRGYTAMTRWEFSGLRLHLPLIVAVQIVAGAGYVLGVALFFHHVPASAAIYVSTGVPVINIVMLGLIFGPQMVADQKIEQGYEYLRALPAPRTSAAAAWYTVTLIGGLPGVIVSLSIAHLRYDLAFSISPTIVPAILLTCFTGTMIGYALGHAVEDAMQIRLVAQLLVFIVFGFTPIVYPVQQMPGWLGALNWWFPFRHMAVIVRAGLTRGLVDGVAVSWVIVGVWGLACAGIAALALGRRR